MIENDEENGSTAEVIGDFVQSIVCNHFGEPLRADRQPVGQGEERFE